MRVLMQIRSNAFSLQGGDTLQLIKTKEGLIKKGHDVDVSLELKPDLKNYDVIHLFNITRVQETFIQSQNAKKQNKPIVLSTIYWPNNEFEKNNGGLGLRGFFGRTLSIDQIERMKAIAKFLVLNQRDEGTKYLITHSYRKMQQQILDSADVFLPNAMEEMNQIKHHLNFVANQDDVVVVPNAIDNDLVKISDDIYSGKYDKYKNWIVCVGRIDPRKNQLKLLESLEGTDYKLLLIGKCSNGQKNYFQKVMKKIKNNKNIEYLDHVPNNELYQIYKACKVSVLPSWYETPGLVSLEAASMRCNIVVSEKGTTKDYFGNYAFYCDITNPFSIREQIDKAFNTPFDENFRDYILKNYTWNKAAMETEKGYYRALQKHDNEKK